MYIQWNYEYIRCKDIIEQTIKASFFKNKHYSYLKPLKVVDKHLEI